MSLLTQTAGPARDILGVETIDVVADRLRPETTLSAISRRLATSSFFATDRSRPEAVFGRSRWLGAQVIK
jgi:hypothetical protein